MAGTAVVQSALVCAFCHKSESDGTGKPFHNQHSLATHMARCSENPNHAERIRRKLAHVRGTKVAKNGNGNGNLDAAAAALEGHVAFLVGHCKTFIDLYAESRGLFSPALANRVGQILYRATRRSAVGPPNRVFDLQ